MNDMPSVFECRHPVARCEHCCCECGATIDPGSQYERVDGCWDGRWDHFATCLVCEDLRDRIHEQLYRYDEGPCFTGLWDYAEDLEFLCWAPA